MAFGAGPGRPSGDDVCDRVLALIGQEGRIKSRFERAFDDAEIFALTRGQMLAIPFAKLAAVARTECNGQPEQRVDIAHLMRALKGAMAAIDRAFAEILAFEPAAYRPRSVAEFKRFDLSAFPGGGTWLAFGFEQGLALGNSSTNYDRKRAAYVLKHFFCDDIVAAPQPPAAGISTDVKSGACAGCHQKLDPMAGFFRNYGAFFFDYSKTPVIVFDDLAVRERDDYVLAWQRKSGAGPLWNIGFVRSASATSANAYGRSLADLSRIIRGAPEAKRCLMQRLFEYLVAEKQTIDNGYLDDLTRNFENEAKIDSAAAMKNAIVRIVTGRTFHQRDPDPRQCYDYAPGASPADSPPCRIAFILKENCTSCHDSAYGGDGNLDLTALIASPDGRGRTFPHLDDALEQQNARETFARLVERLTTDDAKRRMPKGRAMRGDERDELLRWARDALARLPPEARK
jgi:mono/diheme cytochrome c family protein